MVTAHAAATLRLNRSIDIVDGIGRPLFGGSTQLTVAKAAEALRGLDLPGFIEATWQVTPSAPVSIERQISDKVRRLKKLGALCGRAVVRVDQQHGFPTHYRALLAR